MKDYFVLAFGNLKHRGLRSWLTLLGILIGITAVVALVMLGDGLRAAVNGQFGISTTTVLTVQAGSLNAYGPPGSGVVNPLTMDDLRAIEKIDSVEAVLRRNIPAVSLEFNDQIIFGYGINVPSGENRKFAYDVIDVEPEVGRLLKEGDNNYVMLGNNFLTDKVGLEKPMRVGNKIKINDREFEVIGIMKKKGSFIFDNIVYMNEEPLQDLMQYGDKIDVMAVRVKDKDLMDKTKIEVVKILRKNRDVKVGEEDFEVSTPDATLSTVDNILGGIQAFIIIIASVSIIVGAVGIVNTMTTSVLERRKEIGIMKAIGAKNSQVFYQFFIESGLLGLIGGIVGIILGGAIGFAGITGLNQFLGSEAAPNMNIIFLSSVLLGSFLIGAIAGIAPALQAANQDPRGGAKRMINKELAKYSLRGLAHRKTRSFLTILSILLGIATIFIFISFGLGLYNYIGEFTSSTSADKLIIQAKGSSAAGLGSSIIFNDDDLKAIKKAAGVYEVAGSYAKAAEVSQGDKKIYAFLLSYDPKTPLMIEFMSVGIEKGRELLPNDRGKVVLGHNYLIDNKIFPNGYDINQNIEINGRDRNVGFYESVGNPQDDSQIYVTNDFAEELYAGENLSYGMIVAEVDTKNIDLVVENVEKSLRSHRNQEKGGKEDFSVQSFAELLNTYLAAMNIVIGFVILIALISVIVSAVNTSNTMITSVIERIKEIGVIKSIGGKNSAVFGIFLFESGFLGFVSGVIGTLLGWGLSSLGGNILDNLGWGFLSPAFPISLFVGCIAFATITGAISGVIPAYRASKINPVTALRYE